VRPNLLPLFIAGIILAFGFSSCAILNRYQSPEIKTENLYRDNVSSDTIADIPWKAYFTDSNLISLIEEGLQHNADLQVAVLNIRQAEAQLNMARAAYFPNISLAGQVTNLTTSDANRAFSHNSNEVSLGIVASWELEVWGKLTSQKKSQYARFLKSHACKNMIQSSLIANIATSYYSLLALDEQLLITKETVGLLEENVVTMEALKTAGRQNAAAVEQSKSLMLSTKLSIYDLENSIRQMENAICMLLGREPGAISRTTFDAQTVPEQLQAGVPAQLLSRRPDVRLAELDFRSAFELTNVARANFYPSVTLNSGSMIGVAASGFTDFFSIGNLIANVVGGLTQPLFNRGQLKGNLKIAQAQQEIALVTFKNTVLKAGQEVSDILFSYQSSVKKNAVRQEQIQSTQKAVEYTQALLTADEANYTEVLTAGQNHLSAQLNRVSDKLEQMQCAVNLYRALGGGGK
jgi:NodT family efflux transporter outer membrane factor (OMF) lipoprotein